MPINQDQFGGSNAKVCVTYPINANSIHFCIGTPKLILVNWLEKQRDFECSKTQK